MRRANDETETIVATLEAMASNRYTVVGHPSDHNVATFFTGTTGPGVAVNPDTAMTYAAYFSAIRIIAEDIAKLSWKVYRRLSAGGKEEAGDNPVYRLIHTRPNEEMTSFTFRETLQAWALSWGNGYAEIELLNRGTPAQLWPIEPNRVHVDRDGRGRLIYDVMNPNGGNTVLPAERVLHIKGLGFDGIRGYSIARLARESLALGMNAERYGSKLFTNSGRPSGVVEVPEELSDGAYKRLKESWNEQYGGANALQTALLEGGAKWNTIGIPPEDAQFLQTRTFQVLEVARWFRLAPHKLAELSGAKYANIEHQGIEHQTDTLLPWAMRWDQETDRKLFTESERGTYFVELNLESILKGDTSARYSAYHVALQDGWINRDEVRARENLNPMPNGQGKVYLFPLNMAPAEKVISGEAAAKKPAPVPPVSENGKGEDPDKPDQPNNAARAVMRQQLFDRIAKAHERVLEDAAGRILRREKNAIERNAKKHDRDGAAFGRAVGEFMDENAAYARAQVLPAVEAMIDLAISSGANANAIACRVSSEFGAEHASNAAVEMKAAFAAGTLPALLSQWESRSETIGRALARSVIQSITLEIGAHHESAQEDHHAAG